MQAMVQQLQQLGLSLQDGWVRTAVANGASSRDTLLSLFLWSDMTESSDGCLPQNWEAQTQLRGRFVLQLNEVVNIGAPARDRYKEQHNGARRCLKLSLTDGKMSVWAMELHQCGALHTNLTAGCKVLLTDPVVHRGILMLMGASIRVLGGGVDRLEGARQRLLEHWNQPLGCSLLSVQARRSCDRMLQEATHAAWPHLQQQQQQVPENVANLQVNTQSGAAHQGPQGAANTSMQAGTASQHQPALQAAHGINASLPEDSQFRGSATHGAVWCPGQGGVAPAQHIGHITASQATQVSTAPVTSCASAACNGAPQLRTQQIAACSSGAVLSHPAAQVLHHSQAHVRGGAPQGPHIAGAAPERGKVVSVTDSDDEDAMLASVSVPAAGLRPAAAAGSSDHHMHVTEEHDYWGGRQDPGVPADDTMEWAPEQDAMDASFVSDDDAEWERPAQLGLASDLSGVENCNRACNDATESVVSSIKDLVTDFARGSGAGRYLVNASFQSAPEGPMLYVFAKDGSRTPAEHFMVTGVVKDRTGTLSRAMISHDFLVKNGCGSCPAALLSEMSEWKTQGRVEENAPMIAQLDTIIELMEKRCLLRVERCQSSKRWMVSTVDPPTGTV